MPQPQHIIRSVEPLHIGQFLIIRIETNHGVTGHIEAAATAVRRFASYLIDKPAFATEHHWNGMHRYSYFQGMAINAAISGIDIALGISRGKCSACPCTSC
jgi:galactonate dehydratase